MRKKKKTDVLPLRIIPLGGMEQIGMNITAFEYADSIVVVDCGLAFPENDMLGIDLIIPDVGYLKKNIEKVKGIFITHGHEDHIGALPYILRDINVPVYATKLTMGLIDNKLREHDLLESVTRNVVAYKDVVEAGDFSVEYINTNHSIADAAALAIKSPAGTIVHTGDFKIDFSPVFGEVIDLQRFAELGREGVLALLCDSTNILRPGYTPSEKTLAKTFDSIISDNPDSRIIIATFSSNVDRLQQILNSAVANNRKVVIEGRSMTNVVNTASELGYLNIPANTIISIEEMSNYPDNRIVLITTGSQGESMAALSRMAASIHRKIRISPGDTIVFSSSPIPGNEKNVSKVINELAMQGARVIFQDAHVSGHACQEEIKMIYALTKPKFAVPVHGEYRYLLAHAELAVGMGVAPENTFILSSGDILEINGEQAKVVAHEDVTPVMVDGLGVGDVGNKVLKDRQILSENGLISVVMVVDKASNTVVSGPEIISRGFVYMRESEDLIDEAIAVVEDTIENCRTKGITDWNKIKSEIRDSLSDYLWKKMKRNPMILPVVMEV